MAIVDTSPVDHDVPHEKGAIFGLRKLPWTELKEARKLEEKEMRLSLRDYGAEVMAGFRDGDKKDDQEVLNRIEDAQQYRAGSFDTQKLLELGIAHWSGPTYDGVKVTPKNVGKLDAQTADWCAQAVVDLTRPPTEEEEGNS